jgi:hypothetical protein
MEIVKVLNKDLLVCKLDEPLKAGFLRSLVGRTIVGVETFAVGDERELDSVGLLLNTPEPEDEKN